MKNSGHFSGIFLLLIVVFFPLRGMGSSNNVTVQSLLDDIREKSVALQSMKCTFTQTKKMSMFQDPITFQGRLVLVRPDKLRWEFTTPVPSVLIFNGDNGIRCTENKGSDTFDLRSDPVMKMVAEQLWSWLDGKYAELEKNYAVILAGSSSLIITPLRDETAQFITKITLEFDENSRQPKTVLIAESGGDETFIEFRDYILSPLLPPDTFRKCPSGD